MKIEIWNGCGNRFALIFCKKKINKLEANQIKEICNEFSTDGLILISKRKFINMCFFNPDGSKDNCGNGLRVVAAFCFKEGLSGRKGIIKSLGMQFPFKISYDKVSVVLKQIESKNGILIISKVPHKVVEVDSFVNSDAQRLRNLYNCNITLVRRVNTGAFAKTYEVGVENFTASCGTGAVATSIVTNMKKIFMPGGLLEVETKNKKIILSGKTEMEGVVEYDIKD